MEDNNKRRTDRVVEENFNESAGWSGASCTDLVVLGVAAPGEKVDEQEDEGEDEPRGRHRPDDAQALQVQLRLGSKTETEWDIFHLISHCHLMFRSESLLRIAKYY